MFKWFLNDFLNGRSFGPLIVASLTSTRVKALDEIYKMYTHASLGEKNRIENVHTFALLESHLKTKKSASGKRHPDEAHGSGEETSRPQQCSEVSGSREKKVHKARCSNIASRDCADQKIKACDGTSAPLRRQKFSKKVVRNFSK